MRICNNCGHVEEDEGDWVVERYREYIGGRLADEYLETSCPDCGSDDISDAEQCPICEKWVAEEEMCLVTVELPADDTLPDGGEETMQVCPCCCDDFAGGRNILFNLFYAPKENWPEFNQDFRVGRDCGTCIFRKIYPDPLQEKAIFIMHIPDDEVE